MENQSEADKLAAQIDAVERENSEVAAQIDELTMDKETQKKDYENFLRLSIESWIIVAHRHGRPLHSVATAIRDMADGVIAEEEREAKSG